MSAESGEMDLAERFRGAFLTSAIGDALGWPTEFMRSGSKGTSEVELPVRDFVRWTKRVGGRFWAYEDEIEPGSYSDDTQLKLSVARCITNDGHFKHNRFAYAELPLWLHYERGGGKTVKTAAKHFAAGRSWLNNFERESGEGDYREAGANGGAMRILPLALVSPRDDKQFYTDTFLNTIATHGHPRAILGSITFGVAVRELTYEFKQAEPSRLISEVTHKIEQAWPSVKDDARIAGWIYRWDLGRSPGAFQREWRRTLGEIRSYLRESSEFSDKSDEAYYKRIGALEPESKGSGSVTVAAALHLFSKYHHDPSRGLEIAANILGSDTDTIGGFLGALLGASHGRGAAPRPLVERVQDRDYLLQTAERLHEIATRSPEEDAVMAGDSERQALSEVVSWEFELVRLFDTETHIGDKIYHPVLGRGRIEWRREKPVAKPGYTAHLVKIVFDSGQSAVFRSRIGEQGIASALGKVADNALQRRLDGPSP